MRRLFRNVPARLKFLKSNSTELAHCVGVASRLALAHPPLALNLRHGVRELIRLAPAEGKLERRRDHFGEEFGGEVPVSSLKGHLGHTLGACGALEAWLTLEMMREGWLAPTRNLDVVDPRCARLDHVMAEARPLEASCVMSNNFAFGGINTSLLFRRP